MTKLSHVAWDDTVLPFQLDRSNVRGRIARLDGVLEEVLHQHSYPAMVEALVAEMAVLTALIGQTLKLRWKLSLQVRGKGPIRILASDYYAPAAEGAPAQIRAWASFDAERLDETAEAFGQIGEGYFAVLIDQGEGNLPYQGLTGLTGGSLTACAEAYFAQSEQLPTRFELAFGRASVPGGEEHWRAGGVMVQMMPALSTATAETAQEGAQLSHAAVLAGEADENWTRANVLLDTVEEMELIGPSVSLTNLLVRLFNEEIPRVFDAQAVQFGCTCSEDRVRTSLSIYSKRDIGHMTTPEGTVTADCQFCGAHYVFDPATLGFEASKNPDGSLKEAGNA